MPTLHSSIKWIKKEHGGAFIRSKATVLAFATTIYAILVARNQCLFATKAADVDSIVVSIQFNVYKVLHSLYPLDMYLSL